MAIENRDLPIGTRLVANYKKQAYVCTVEAAAEGEGLAFVLADGQRFKSPSAAGSRVMGGGAVNGWRFWSVEGDEPAENKGVADVDALLRNAGEKPAKPAKGAAKSEAKAKAKKQTRTIYKAPNQQALAQGQTRFFCAACMASFAVDGDSAETCPQGHSNAGAELNAPSGVSVAEEAEVTA